MSGSKVISVSGIAQTSATASTAGISGAMVAMGAATVVGLTALVTAAEMAVTLTGKAINAYQERVRQQKEAAEQRERAHAIISKTCDSHAEREETYNTKKISIHSLRKF